MAKGKRPIQRVYDAFRKVGREKETFEVKNALLEALEGQGIDLTKTSTARLAAFLRGELRIEDLQNPAEHSL